MECPFCKVDIDHDSFYCDQCGQEIFVCPKCDKPGRGKRCTSDGTPLVSKKNIAVGASANIQADKDVVPIGVNIALQDSSSADSMVSAPELRLINKNLGLDLKMEDGNIIGRETGRFANLFGRYDQVSGTHAKFKFDQKKGWTVADIGTNKKGSTNGTFHNNVRLNPLEYEAISDGSVIRIANIEFYVQTNPARKGTMRM